MGNLITGNFNLGFEGQPVAHNDWLWNFLGMALAGFGSVLLGGCPLRQIILSAEGNIDSVITFLGLLIGAAFAHNFELASSGRPDHKQESRRTNWSCRGLIVAL